METFIDGIGYISIHWPSIYNIWRISRHLFLLIKYISLARLTSFGIIFTFLDTIFPEPPGVRGIQGGDASSWGCMIARHIS